MRLERFTDLLFGKQLLEAMLCLAEPRISENYRLLLSDWIVNEPLLVQPPKHVPIHPFPRTYPIMQGQIEDCQGCFIDLVRIDVHRYLLAGHRHPYEAQRNAGKRRAEKALAKLDDAAPRVRLTGWLGSHSQRTTIALVYAMGMTFGVTTGLVWTRATELTGD